MACCTFFGHQDCPSEAKERLYIETEKLITEKSVTKFYIGNHGNFDRLATNTVKDLQIKYPHIQYHIVLAYLTSKDSIDNSIYPEGLELIPKRFVISKRNEWMIANSDFVICYVNRSYGGAVQFMQKAIQKNKPIINIAK